MFFLTQATVMVNSCLLKSKGTLPDLQYLGDEKSGKFPTYIP